MGLNRRGKLLSAQLLFLYLAFALRLYRLGVQSLWADEGNSAAMVLRDFSSIALHAAADIHPPLYYWLLKLWAALAGTSEWGLRALSAFIGLLLVAVVYSLGKEFGGEKVALVGMALAAFHPFQVYYAQEARMYMLVAFLGALSFWSAMRWWRKENLLAGAIFVLSTGMGLYAHYSFPVILAVENLAFPIFLAASYFRKRIGVKGYVARWFLLQAIALAIYAPWVPIALERLTSWPAIAEYGAYTALVEALKALVFGPASRLPSALALIPVLLALAGSAICWRNDWRAVAVLWAWLLAPVLMMLFLGLYRGAYLKFLLVSAPPLCLLLAIGLSNLRGRWSLVGAFSLTVVLMLFSAALRDFYFHFTKDDYRGIARYIEAVERPGDAVILNAPGQIDVFRYYYRGKLSLIHI